MEKKNVNGFGLAGLIVSIISLCMACCMGGFLGVIGFVLGLIGVTRKDKKKGTSIAAIIISVISVLFSTIFLICILLGVSLPFVGKPLDYLSDSGISSYIDSNSNTDSTQIQIQPDTEEYDDEYDDFIDEDYVEDEYVYFNGGSFLVPADWIGKYTVDETDEYVTLYQTSSYESIGNGSLFSIMTYTDGSYVNLPNYTYLGFNGGISYIMAMPTDVCYDYENETIAQEYLDMCDDYAIIESSFLLDSSDGIYMYNSCIFPNSSYIYLTEEDLMNLDKDGLAIARNEIYARYGRKFGDANLQSYFDSATWYVGLTEPENFDDNILNECEKANVQLISGFEKTE